ncbi:primase-helicase family protein [Sunxiuqinia indica]|uniref:primase-helicase family protein n=1 Tax=Sunxiuqinia indica TaxID=2692584 RepID=UPI00135CF6A8|nr:primase-helicase family protein [Sunxiuqinia indica]
MSKKSICFKPEFYNVNGDYLVSHLKDDGVSVRPTLSKVKESVLETNYKMNDETKSNIPRFANFALVPENNPENYKREINLGDGLKNFNLYELPFHPAGKHELNDGKHTNWPNILELLLHIAPHKKPFPKSRFTYIELLLDYLAIAWRHPKQRLPILVLVSSERSTGKTTFLQFLELMFQSNAKMVSVFELESAFNNNWGLANFVLVDEAKIPDKLLMKIRNESTSKSRNINTKFMQSYEVPNYSKFAMATNNITNFAKIEDEENRYFMIEVEPFTTNQEKRDYLELVIAELPQFLDYLAKHHIFSSENKTRFWFDYEDYKTPALEKVISGSKNDQVTLKVEELFKESIEKSWQNCPNNTVVEFSISGIRDFLGFTKSADQTIKMTLSKLGFQISTVKERYLCLFHNQETHAIRYYCPLGTLRTIFFPEIMDVN